MSGVDDSRFLLKSLDRRVDIALSVLFVTGERRLVGNPLEFGGSIFIATNEGGIF